MDLGMDLSVRIERWPLAVPSPSAAAARPKLSWSWPNSATEPTAAAENASLNPRYGESPDRIVAAIEAMRPALHQGLDRAALQVEMPPALHVMHSIVLTGTLTPNNPADGSTN